MAKSIYKVTFLSAGRIYDLFAGRVVSGEIWGFVEVSDLMFDVHEGIVIHGLPVDAAVFTTVQV